MIPMSTLQEKLAAIFVEALEENWGLVEDDFKGLAVSYLNQLEIQSPQRIDRAIATAVSLAIDVAVTNHIQTTFAEAVNAIAEEKARAQIAARLKRRGMSMDWLDARPASQDIPPEPGSET